MNQKNFEYLREQVKFTGFGVALEEDLKEKLKSQPDEFQLYYRGCFGADEGVATLFFKRSAHSDLYFFNKYEVILKRAGTDNISKRVFYIGKENNFTFKEAYNIMCGRSVHKELTNMSGAHYTGWVQLDRRQPEATGAYKLRYFHENYGFDILTELKKYPIRELENEETSRRLVASLYKGNHQAVTWVADGVDTVRFIEANPRFKSLRVYDDNHRRIDKLPCKPAASETEGAGDPAGGGHSREEAPKEKKKKSKASPGKQQPKSRQPGASR